MSSPQLTQCPKCQTSFRITPTQLRAAAGSVRCGSCLDVFDAREHMVGAKNENTEDQAEPSFSNQKTATPVSVEQTSDNTSKQEQLSAKNDIPHREKEEQQAPESLTTSIQLPEKSHDHFETIFSDLEKEQIESAQNHSRSRVRLTGWITLILISFITLVGQYAWFNKDQLATNLKLRPAYALVCQIMDCQLPTLIDLTAIKSIQLLVRSTPNNNEGLIVDSVIINEAPFAQPWPKLNLIFSNINGQIVASRTFSPSEYLGGALAGSREIPSGKPVRLSLEIVDPGEGAVNYQLNLL